MFETEAMIPLDIGLPSLRVKRYDHVISEAALRANLDLLDEIKEKAFI